MAKALKNRGVQTSIITTDVGIHGKAITNKWLSTTYGKVIYFGNQYINLPVSLIWTSFKLIKSHDCVYLNSIFYPPSFLLATVAVWKKKPVVWSCRGNLHPQALIYGTWKKLPIIWFIKTFLSGKNILFHATSMEESTNIKTTFGDKFQVVTIPNYLEIPELQDRSNASPPYFLYIGRLHPIKALDILIVALGQSRLFKQSKYVLKMAGIGDEDYVRGLKIQITQQGLDDHIHFLGLVEGEEKEKLYSNAHFTVLPSHSENFGNVVIESLAQGTPVIASKGTPWEVLEKEQAGFWTENTAMNLAETLDCCITLTSNEYVQYRKRALALAVRDFDIQGNIGKWIDTYQQVISF